jgi:hypothetical protein
VDHSHIRPDPHIRPGQLTRLYYRRALHVASPGALFILYLEIPYPDVRLFTFFSPDTFLGKYPDYFPTQPSDTLKPFVTSIHTEACSLHPCIHRGVKLNARNIANRFVCQETFLLWLPYRCTEEGKGQTLVRTLKCNLSICLTEDLLKSFMKNGAFQHCPTANLTCQMSLVTAPLVVACQHRTVI